MSLRLQRITKYLAAAGTVAAFAAPTALAGTDLRSPDTRDAAFAAQAGAARVDLRSPDTRDAGAAIKTTSPKSLARDLRSPDARDWAAGDLPGRSPDTIAITVVRPGGFDWADAGIGAGAALGLVMLLGGASVLVRHARTEPRPT